MELHPILIVDDDPDDLELIKECAVVLEVKRPIYFFQNGEQLMKHLINTDLSPFLIISDVNLPRETGFDIRRQLTEHPELRYKSVPFIFWSTDASERQIQEAYDLPAQGFFFKPNNFEDLCDTFEMIIRYWQKSQHPKKVL